MIAKLYDIQGYVTDLQNCFSDDGVEKEKACDLIQDISDLIDEVINEQDSLF